MTMTTTTTMLMTTMSACNAGTQHTHHLSFTDGPRKGEQASITIIDYNDCATRANEHLQGGGAS